MSQKLLFLIILNISIINSINIKNNDFFTPEIKNLIKIIDRLSRNKNNEAIMKNLLQKFKRYILNHDIKRPEAPIEKYKNITLMKANFTIDNDGTYDLYTHDIVEFDKGYQASFETKYDFYTENDYIKLVYKLSLMTDNEVYLGVFEGDDEFSFHFDDYELANVICILFNQYSMLDWKTKKQIKNPYFKEFS